ncbi:MAG: DNA gyrase C-terminal beta-propeller domain-containing protein, partial [Bacteroidota bacterium]|nr:DNA gyrase C-terminal beta-propeller domain-containing protein [Bacteroidota bacterium]
KQLIHYFAEHRHDVIIRRTQFELDQAEKRAHILEGLIIACDNIDEVIRIIRSSKTPDEARERLIEKFSLSDIQSRAIVEMRLRQLTGLEQDKLRAEYEEIEKLIEYLKRVLAEEPLRMQIIKDELLEIKEKYGDSRRTKIEMNAEEFNPEDFFADEQMVITISHMGYIKRTALTEFKTQGRGGVGSKGSTTRDEDFLEHMFVATMHNTLLLFTEKGKCFWLKVYEIPEGTKVAKGRAVQNLLNIEQDDKIRAYINVQNLKDEEYINNNFIILCTKKGIIKKTSLEAYSRPRQNGVNAITIREGDQLIEARLTGGNHEILMAVKSGKAIRFNEDGVRAVGRTASGVKGITLKDEDDEVVGMVCIENESEDVMVVSDKGYGKRSPISDYRITNRGGKGVKTISITDKTGDLIAIKNVVDTDDLMIITLSGIAIRLPISQIRMMGRNTQGVRLINLRDTDSIASIARVINSDEEESVEMLEGEENSELNEGDIEVGDNENNS